MEKILDAVLNSKKSVEGSFSEKNMMIIKNEGSVDKIWNAELHERIS